MTEVHRCTSCDAEISDGCPAGLCRRCLLRIGMQDLPPTLDLDLQCPQCAQQVQVHDAADLRNLACPACGNRFSVVDELTEVQTTLGQFDLLERIGSGSFGVVWKARDRQLDRIVVVKLPHERRLSALEAEDFLREARAAAQLKHPNIVTVHEVSREDDLVYIVSDYIAGRTLAERLQAEAYAPREAAELCATLADALHHAHEKGIVHRDLKPSNIMLDSNHRPHIMDFGLAKREASEMSVTIGGRVLGTPSYMSPEQARGDSHQADRRSDVYSLGVILFELLTGEKPFRGELRMLLHQVMHEDPPSPRRLNGRVPRDLETICLKCLEKSPPRRYESAAALGEDLRRYLAGQPIAARPITFTGRLWRWSVRNPTEAVLGVAAASLLSVLAIGGPVVAMRQTKLASQEAAARQQADQDAGRVRTVYREATAHYTKAFTLLEDLIIWMPKDSMYRQRLADVYNELAWFLATSPDPQLRDPRNALELAQLAVRHAPDSAWCWRTLGVARYRMGRWQESLEALKKSRSLSRESAGPDLLFMAMAHWQLEERATAMSCYHQYAAGRPSAESARPEMQSSEQEAQSLLQIEEPPHP